MYSIARLISAVFIPPTFTLLAFIFLAFTYELNLFNKIYLLVVTLIFGVTLQISSFIFFYKRGMISDIDAANKNERSIPFLASIIIFTFGFILLLIPKINLISLSFWFCYISNTFFIILINKYFKISVHALGVSSFIALFVFIFGVSAMILMIILFVVSWSRVHLKIHTISEVTAGAALGFISVYLQLLLFLR